MRQLGHPGHVKVIFSQRGGHTYGHTFAYGEILKLQSRAGTTFLQKRTINWQVVDRRLMEELPHGSSAGLQLADIVASSFYQAVDVLPPTKWEPMNAKLLQPRMATEDDLYRDYGVALQPTPPRKQNCFGSSAKFLSSIGTIQKLFKEGGGPWPRYG
jgi:hypothetical protein